MFRSKLLTAALCISAIALVSEGAVRVRYSYCMNHMSTANANCDGPKRSAILRDSMITGIWDNYNATAGFDNVADNDLGALDKAPYVSATYWIDSVYEASSTALRKNGALVEGFATSADLRNPAWTFGLDGYVIYAAGHLKMEQAGVYEIKMDFNDGMVVWLDKNEDGEISLDNTNDALNGTYDAGARTWNYAGTDKGSVFPVTVAKPGQHKLMFWFWDWGEVSYSMLSWKTPGATDFVPIPVTAFGKRRQFGLPVSHITKIEMAGAEVPQASWSFLEVAGCKELTFTASADNMMGATPTFFWEFGDGVKWQTTTPTVKYTYSEDTTKFAFSPSVKVQRNTVVSSASGEVILVAVSQGTKICTPSTCSGGCQPTGVLMGRQSAGRSTISVNAGVISVPRSASDKISFSLYSVAGRKVMVAKSADGRFDVGAAHVPAGMYVVNVTRNGVKEASVPIMVNAR